MCNLSDGVWKKVQERGEARGRAEGRAEGEVLGSIKVYREMGFNDNETIAKIISNFSINVNHLRKDTKTRGTKLI